MLSRFPSRSPLLAGLLMGTMTLLSVAACATYPQATVAPTAGVQARGASITVRPTFAGFRVNDADVLPFGAADVTKIVVELYAVPTDANLAPLANATEEPVTVSGEPVVQERFPGFNAPVTFDNLKLDTYYRIRVKAYRTDPTDAAQLQLISTEDADSYVDVPVTRDPATHQNDVQLKVQLRHRGLSVRLMGDPAAVTAAAPPVEVAPVSPTTPVMAYNSRANTYLMVWADPAAGHDDIYAQRLSADGEPLGGVFLVSSSNDPSDLHDHAAGHQNEPAVAYSAADDRFFVAWIDRRGLYSDVYGQAIKGTPDPQASGDQVELDGNNTLVAASLGNTFSRPSVAAHASADEATAPVLVAWEDTTLGTIHFRKLTASGAADGLPFQLLAPLTGPQSQVTLGYDPHGHRYVASFVRNGPIVPGIYVQYLQGHTTPTEAAVNLTGGSAQIQPALALNPADGSFMLAYVEGGYAYVRRYVNDAPTDVATPISGVLGTTASHPRLAFSAASGEYLATWTYNQNSFLHKRAMRFSKAGAAIGASFDLTGEVGNTAAHGFAYNPTDNDALLVWRQEGINPNPAKLYGRRVDFFAQVAP